MKIYTSELLNLSVLNRSVETMNSIAENIIDLLQDISSVEVFL